MNKGMMKVEILEILKKQTDDAHTLTQAQIADILQEKHGGEKPDRKAIKRNLAELSEVYPIEHDEIPRGGDPDADPICTNWRYVHPFEEAQLHLLINLVRSSGKAISGANQQELIRKIRDLGSEYFSGKILGTESVGGHTEANKQLFYIYETLETAIFQKKQVSFYYQTYDSDLKMKKKKDANGEDKYYTVSPYLIFASNGRHYLIADRDRKDIFFRFRLDRILDIKIRKELPCRPMEEIPGYREVAENPTPYVFSGKSIPVQFRILLRGLDPVMDSLDRDRVRVLSKDADFVTVSTEINREVMKNLAVQFCAYIEITSPTELREDVRGVLSAAAEKYRK